LVSRLPVNEFSIKAHFGIMTKFTFCAFAFLAGFAQKTILATNEHEISRIF